MRAINYTAADVETVRHQVPIFDEYSRVFRAAAEKRGDPALKLATLVFPMSFFPEGGTTFSFDLASQEVNLSIDDAFALIREIVTETATVVFGDGSGQTPAS
jgi:hypothetical protein